MKFPFPNTKILVWCLLLGLLVTLISGYYFGLSDQLDFLPAILRQMDPTILLNDHKVSEDMTVSPKFYFNHTIVFLAQWLPLHIIFFVLTWLINALIALTTYLLARDLFDDRPFVSWLSVFVVLSFLIFDPGVLTQIISRCLIAGTLAQALILFGFWAVLRDRILLGLSLFLPAILFHPQLSPSTAMIALATCSVKRFLDLKSEKASIKEYIKEFRPILLAMGAIIACAWLFFICHLERSLSTAEFKLLTVDLRNSHHMKPSTFNKIEFWKMFAFFCVFGFAWSLWWKRSLRQRNLALSLLTPAITILMLCLCGYIFVEIFPVRFFISVQPFRLLFLPKWIGNIVIVGGLFLGLDTLSRSLASGQFRKRLKERIDGLQHRLNSDRPVRIVRHGLISLLLFFLVAFSVHSPSQTSFFKFTIFSAMGLCLGLLPRRLSVAVGSSLILFLLILTFNFQKPWVPSLLQFSRTKQPLLRLEDHNDSVDQLAKFAKAHSDKNDIFLVPFQGFGRFRIIAQRAVVIDFYGFSFTDAGMAEWKQRMIDCYSPNEKSFLSISDMVAGYKHITTRRILRLAQKYGFSYAVLHTNTPTNLPIIFGNKDYKIIRVGQRSLSALPSWPEPLSNQEKRVPKPNISIISLDGLGLTSEEAYLGDGLIGQRIMNPPKDPDIMAIPPKLFEINGRTWELYKIKGPNDLILAQLYTLVNNSVINASYQYISSETSSVTSEDISIRSALSNFAFPRTILREYLHDQLHGLNGIYHEPYLDGKMESFYMHGMLFGFVFVDKFYLKTTSSNRSDYIRSGMSSFGAGHNSPLNNFYEVPEEILRDKAALNKWVKRAIFSGPSQ